MASKFMDNSSIPVITAFLLGLLTAVSPCPLATNITAIGYIGRNIENRQIVLRNGLLYIRSAEFYHTPF